MGQGTQLSLEGVPIEGLRASLQAVHFTPTRPLRSGERVRIVIDGFVSELRFPFSAGEEEGTSTYKLRQHMIEAVSFTIEEEDG